MERLTKRMLKGTGYYMKCSETCPYDCQENCDCEEFDKFVDRLAAIEDVLGDDYDLDQLRELVEADRQQEFQRHLKRFDIKPPIPHRPESGLAKYIDVEAFVRELAEACDEIDLRFLRGRAVKEAIDTVKNHISAMPDADVAPVVHGHWVSTVSPLGAGDAELRCSVCGRVCHEKNAPYCYCGAKMDGESPT